MLDARLIVDLVALEQRYPEWDALAVSNGLPRMTPGWLIAWWRHLSPESSLLRVVEVRDGGELVGLAPLYALPPRHGHRVAYRLLDGGAPLAPLARAGYEGHVAEMTGWILSRSQPRPDLIELQGVPPDSGWHIAMRERWPGRTRPITRVYRTQACPVVSLGGLTLDSWLAGRSGKFRASMRRLRRLFDEQGGSWRMATTTSLQGDIETFKRLHAARWHGRGDSAIVARAEQVGAMLDEAGRSLLADERFRLWVMEIDGEAIGADVYLAGGGTVAGINGGWDERWKRLSPPLLATMHTIEDSIARGERRVDLGPGAGSHKARFADDDRPVASSALILPGRRLAHTVALTGSRLAGSAVRSHARRVWKPGRARDRHGLPHRVRAAGGGGSPLRSSWRFTAAAAAVTAAAAHVPVTEDSLDDAAYIGVLFILLSCACLFLAARLIRRDTHTVWRALVAVCGLAIAALVWSRAVGLPQDSDDVGRWTEPLGIVAACAESLVVVLGGLALSGRARAQFVHRTLPVRLGLTCLAAGLTATAFAAVDDHHLLHRQTAPPVHRVHGLGGPAGQQALAWQPGHSHGGNGDEVG